MSRYDLYRYLIVDDEQHCIDVLKYELQQCGVRESLIYSASSGEEASEYIELVKPDLVFLDIDMPRIDGFQLLEKAENIKHFIVTTAYEKYAIQAIKAHAINYILKPVNHSELKSALSHFHDICNMPLNASSSIVQQQLSYMNSKKFDSIVVSGQNVLHICKLEEICALSAENTYTVIHLKDNKQIVSSKNLGHYESILPEHSFMRIHRKYLINISKLQCIDKTDGGSVMLEDGLSFPISRQKMRVLKSILSVS